MEEAVQEALDRVARACMKMIGKPGVSNELNRRLAKFLYGCMNQRLTIVERVQRRGVEEYAKVLLFASQAAQLLAEIEHELRGKESKD